MCVSPGLAALCYALHVFSNVVHVGDIRPLLRVGVDAHIYQVPQLVGGEETNRVSDGGAGPEPGSQTLTNEGAAPNELFPTTR